MGRVQTPTLRLVVDRDRSIADFVPIAYWAIDVQLSHEGTAFTAQWRADPDACDDQERCLNQALARDAAMAMSNAASARTLKVRTERLREAAPLPFDLGTLQEVCSKKLGLGAQETLDIAQSLYETYKLITYPRSDCGFLPLSQHSEAPAILAALAQADPSLGIRCASTCSRNASPGPGTTPRSAPTTASFPPPPPGTSTNSPTSSARSIR